MNKIDTAPSSHHNRPTKIHFKPAYRPTGVTTGTMNQTWIRFLPKFIRKSVEGRHELQKVMGNTGWLYLDNFIRMGIGFFVNAWIIRYLGPERFGILSYAIAFTALFAPIAQLGLDAVVVRDIVSEPERRGEIIGSAFALKFVAAILTIVLAMIAIFVIRPEDRTSHLLVGIIILCSLFQSLGVIDFWFQSQVASKFSSIARSSACIFFYAVKVVMIFSNASLAAFAWVGVAELAFFSSGLIIAYHIAGQRLSSWRPTRNMTRRLLLDSWLLMVSDLVYFAYLRIDRIMIGEISGAAELGIYSVAAMAAESILFIPTAVSLSLFPSVVEAKTSSEELFHVRLQKYYKLIVFLGYAIAFPLTLCSGWLVPLIFGPTYAKAAHMLVGLAWAGVFMNLILARSYYLTAMNWAHLHFFTDFSGLIINLALNFYLIPRYGGMGAAWASLITYAITAYALCFVSRPLFNTGIMMTKALIYPKFW
jgi:O-antigen/teichoic acid export membrane protein